MAFVEEKTRRAGIEAEAGKPTPGSDYLWLDVALVIVKHRAMIAKLTLAAAVISAVVALVLPVEYTGRTKILPPKENNSVAALLLNSQLGGLASLAGGSGGGFFKDTNDMYVSMIRSRTLADMIITKFDLQKVYRKKTLADTEDELGRKSNISSGADSIITVEVDDKDPTRAAAIANAYIDGLSGLTVEFLNRGAGRRRVFMQEQLDKARKQLADAEADLKSTQEKTGLIVLNDQARAIIENVAKLRAQIAATEVKLQSLRSFATPQNPDVIRLQAELVAMRGQLQSMEQSGPTGEGNVLVPTGKVPSIGLQYADKLRNVKYSEALFELIAKQYELALLDESSTVSTIQVLDRASTPEKKSKPKRSLIVFLSTISALFVGLALAFGKEHLDQVAGDPDGFARLQKLQDVLRQSRARLHLKSRE